MLLRITWRRACAVALLVLVGIVGTVEAEFLSTQRGTLKGLKGARVVVGDLPREAEAEGLTKDRIKTGVVLWLQLQGFPVLATEKGKDSTLTPILLVHIHIPRHDLNAGGVAPYSRRLSLRQVVLLRTGDSAFVTTWSTSVTGTTSKGKLSELQRGVTRDLNWFLKDYVEANRKRR
jgi:hypothetical protein